MTRVNHPHILGSGISKVGELKKALATGKKFGTKRQVLTGKAVMTSSHLTAVDYRKKNGKLQPKQPGDAGYRPPSARKKVAKAIGSGLKRRGMQKAHSAHTMPFHRANPGNRYGRKPKAKVQKTTIVKIIGGRGKGSYVPSKASHNKGGFLPLLLPLLGSLALGTASGAAGFGAQKLLGSIFGKGIARNNIGSGFRLPGMKKDLFGRLYGTGIARNNIGGIISLPGSRGGMIKLP